MRDDYVSGPIIYNEPTRDVMCARDIHLDRTCGHEPRVGESSALKGAHRQRPSLQPSSRCSRTPG